MKRKLQIPPRLDGGLALTEDEVRRAIVRLRQSGFSPEQISGVTAQPIAVVEAVLAEQIR
jgi:hypothetical protein